ncbi:ribosomal RNA small subunit methyltransferase NEP1-like [Zophobas morio]|uniref:ribosomal RNA small subunit methyltransferase NEP1-like n=1 Tax=Zophobas morio TaxID=2755281 RepID=UPI00308396C6
MEFQPQTPKLPKNQRERDNQKRLIVVLERACLETGKVGKEFHLLNCDDHQNILRKNGKNIADARPDITHQCLLTLLDSPLNKAGLLQVYIHTEKGVLIEINPHTRIPRTFKRFSMLMVQLLHKLSVRASGTPEKLLKVIRNPVTDHLPPDCRKIGTTFKAEKCVNIYEYVTTLPVDKPVVFYIGALAHGQIDLAGLDDVVNISDYPLSASVVCGKVCCAFENIWGVL